MPGSGNQRAPATVHLRKACDECHISKVKCKPSSSGSPCTRCDRLGLSCQFSPPDPRPSKRMRLSNQLTEQPSSPPNTSANLPDVNPPVWNMDGGDTNFWDGMFDLDGFVLGFGTDSCLQLDPNRGASRSGEMGNRLPTPTTTSNTTSNAANMPCSVTPTASNVSGCAGQPTLNYVLGLDVDVSSGPRDALVKSLSELYSNMSCMKTSDLQPVLESISFATVSIATFFDQREDHKIHGPSSGLAISLSFHIIEAIQRLATIFNDDTPWSTMSAFGLTKDDMKRISQVICLRQLKLLKSAMVDGAMRHSRLHHHGPTPCQLFQSAKGLSAVVDDMEPKLQAGTLFEPASIAQA